MKLWEAVEIARKTGKAIKNGNEVASWKYSTDALHWESTGAFVLNMIQPILILTMVPEQVLEAVLELVPEMGLVRGQVVELAQDLVQEQVLAQGQEMEQVVEPALAPVLEAVLAQDQETGQELLIQAMVPH
jgi:hypothetical protein